MFTEGIRRLFGPRDAKQRWEERGVTLFTMVQDLKQHPDSESLLVLLEAALDVCERRLAGIENLERVEHYDLMEYVQNIINSQRNGK